MQFEYRHKIGTDYSTVTFTGHLYRLPEKAHKSLMNVLEKMGGVVDHEINSCEFRFPSFISSLVIAQVIRNTCFVCGGLMKDSTAIVDHKFVYTDAGKELWKNSEFAKQVLVRKCQSCGHSHT